MEGDRLPADPRSGQPDLPWDGVFISRRTLITAGHCVFIHDRAGRFHDWARAIRVMPGRNGPALPFGAVTSTDFRSVVGWARDGNPRYDYAAIILPTDLGNQTGWFGYGVFPDAELQGRTASVTGYPGDKREDEDGTMWRDERVIIGADGQKVFHQIDTMGGQSGSAVHIQDGGQPVAIGIHAYGDNEFGNSATRINSPVKANLDSWA